MKFYTHKELFHINSNNKTNSSDTHSFFNVTLDIDPLTEYDRVVVLDACFPKTFYLICADCNKFTVTDDDRPTPTVLQIPVGNYSRRGFKTALEALLGVKYTITFDNINTGKDNGHYYFEYSGTSLPVFTFDETGLYEQMGFNPHTSYTFQTVGIKKQLESVNVMNFKTKNTFYILSNIVQNRGNNILQNIYSQTAGDFEYINWTNSHPDEYGKRYTGGTSNTFWFKIVDEDYNPIDLNSTSTTSNVLLTVMVYKENHIDSLIKGAIKMWALQSADNNE